MMTPQPGDVLIDRYKLVKALRREPGIEAWRANDHVLARDCQLFIVTDPASASKVSTLASALALAKNPRFTPVFQMHSVDDVAVLITDLDDGISLTDYLNGPHRETLSINAMRVILGEAALALQMLISQQLTDRAVTTDVIRLDSKHIRIADAPVSPAMLGPLTHPDDPQDTAEALAVRQLAAVLYAMLTREPYAPDQSYPADKLIAVQDKPHDFWVICQRGLGLPNPDGSAPTPIYTLNELIALLDYWKPIAELGEKDIVWPLSAGEASIAIGQIRAVDPQSLLTLPDGVIQRPQDPSLKAKKPVWDANQLLFPERGEVEMIKPQHHGDGDFLSVLGDNAESVIPSSHPTQAVDVSAIRPIQIKDIDIAPLPPMAPIELTGYDLPDGEHDGRDGHNGRDESQAGSAGDALHDRSHDAAGKLEGLAGTGTGTGTGTEAAPSFPPASFPPAAQAEAEFGMGHGHSERSGAAGGVGVPGSAPVRVPSPIFGAGDGGTARGAAGTVSAATGNESLEETRLQDPLQVGQPLRPIHVESAPPSFVPGEYGDHHDGASRGAGTSAASGTNGDITDDANSYVFGKIRTRSFAIALGSIVLIIALVLSMNYLVKNSLGSLGFSDPQPGQWPTDLSSARFPGRVDATETASSTSSPSESSSASAGSTSGGSTETVVDHEDRNVSSVPTPAPVPTPTNTTAYPIASQSFLNRPAGLNGLGRYVKLDAPHDVYRVDFQLRQPNGSGQIFVNSNAQTPNNGAPVANFTVDAQGNASVTFDQPVNTQEIMIWFPINSLPTGGRLNFASVSVY